MRKEYENEIKMLKARMMKAEKFASSFEDSPFFKDKILNEKMNHDHDVLSFGNKYKSIPLSWGINRYCFYDKSQAVITNYKKQLKKKTYLFRIYINAYSLFDDVDMDTGIHELAAEMNVFFYDPYNTTFYANDKQIVPLLEKLNEWYVNFLDGLKELKHQRKIKETKQLLEKLENETT